MFSRAITGDVWIMRRFKNYVLCCMFSTFHVSSRILANTSELPVVLFQYLSMPWWRKTYYQKITILSLEFFSKLFLFQATFLISLYFLPTFHSLNHLHVCWLSYQYNIFPIARLQHPRILIDTASVGTTWLSHLNQSTKGSRKTNSCWWPWPSPSKTESPHTISGLMTSRMLWMSILDTWSPHHMICSW